MTVPAGVIRVLIADDSAEFRGGLRGLLDAQPGIEVAGEAGDGEEAVWLCGRINPDVVLMDLQMPVMNGIEAARRIANSAPHVGVLMLTMFEDDDSVFAAMRAGARGYLLKGARKAETLRAISAVASGEAIFSPSIARRMMTFFQSAHSGLAAAFPDLTEREREVLGYVGRGRSNQEIASELDLSLKTVRNHVSSILTKLQVVDRAQAAIRARQAGLG